MRIAQVAPLYESVPPKLYGGTERVVSWVTDELVRRGHDVTLFASGDSRTSARLVAPCRRSLRLDPARPDPIAFHTIELAHAFDRACEFDVIHCHVDSLAFPFGRLVSTPTVHTLHGRLDLRHVVQVLAEFRDVPIVSISHAQRDPVRHLPLNWAATVHHGLPVQTVPFHPEPGRYLAFLGRISPEKGAHVAIEVAKRVGLPLRIAAKVDPADQSYFEQIRPLLNHPLVEFIGEVADDEKWRFLGEALALIFPIDWPEPFGITIIEALACGTPVVARPAGSVPELLRDGRTGYVGDSVEDLVVAVKRVDLIERALCRREVEERFSVDAMTDRYEAVYLRLAR
jgi:glycosyltransferase involved in cell wall biosynthesis